MQLREQGRAVAAQCAIVTALLFVVVAAGCGGGHSSDASAAEPAIPDSPPEIKAPQVLPPKKLIVKDLRKGTGVEAKKGDKVMIQYYGITWDGIEHANSWRYPNIPVFKLGEHRLLRGLNMAIPGMKEGGSREVIIPHNLVYYPGVISHQHLTRLHALIYKVYLVKVLNEKHRDLESPRS
jgi:peptidylprolyl isomerase